MQECDLSKTRIVKERQNKELTELQAKYLKMQQLLDYSPAVLYRCQVSSPYGCTFISEKVTAMLGYQPSEFVTNPRFWIDHIHPDDRSVVMEGLTNRKDPDRHVHEYRFRRKEGTYCWVQDELNMVRDEAGSPLEIVGYWMDITQRKEMQEALQQAHTVLERRVQERTANLKAANNQLKREIAERQQAELALQKSEKQFHQIFEHSNDAIFVLDPRKDKILEANPRACELLEYSLQELLSTPMSTIHAQEKSRFQNFCQFVQQQGHGWTDELPCQTKTGRSLAVEISASTMELEGSPYLIAMVRNVTRRKEAEEELRERNRILALKAEIGHILNQNSDFPSLLQNCTKALVQYLDAAFARIWTLNSTDQVLELRASAGLYTHLNGPHSRIPVGQLKIGQIASEKKPHLTNTVIGDPRVNDQEWAKREGMVAFAGYPLMIDQKVLGVMAIFSKKPLTPFTMETLKIVTTYIGVAIERQSHLEARQIHEERNAQILAETRQILNAISDMVLVKGAESRIVWANQAFQSYYGMTNEQLQDLIDAPFNEPHFTQQYLKDDEYVFTTGKILNIPEEPVTRHDGTIRYFHTVKSPIVDADGKVFRIVAVCRDITEEKQSQIIHSRLLNRAIHAEEEERRRIARELHDETGQALTSLLVGLRILQETKNIKQLREQVLKLRKLTGQTIQEVQRMALGLSPGILEDLGLEAAVERLVQDFKETHGVAPTLNVQGLESRQLPFEVETSMFRIIQEALTNIAKHADAKKVDVFIDCQIRSVRIVVKDDGCGFEPNPLSFQTHEPEALGLHGMRQRAIGLGGEFSFESARGRGTCIYVDIPLHG